MAYIWPGIPNGSTSYPSVIGELGLQVEKTVGEVEFPATNLITNGDFSAGTAGWTLDGCTATVSDREITVTSIVDGAPRIYQILGQVVGHKHYARINVQRSSGTTRLVFGGVTAATITGTDAYQSWSNIVTPTATSSFSIYFNDAIVGETIKLKYILCEDLTEIFKAGNEPTAAEMDALMSYWPNSWFDGTANLAQASKMLPYLLAAIRAKADKAQEAWIVPTLINGATGTFKYRKNSLGRLEFSGTLSQASIASNATTTIAGYRPAANINLAVPCTDGTTVGVQLRSTGALYLLSGAAGKTLDFSGVSTSLE